MSIGGLWLYFEHWRHSSLVVDCLNSFSLWQRSITLFRKERLQSRVWVLYFVNSILRMKQTVIDWPKSLFLDKELKDFLFCFLFCFFFFVYFHRIHSSAVRVQLRTIIWNVLFRCPQKVVVRQKSSCVTQSNLLCCLVLQFSALNNLREQSITQRMTFGGVSWCLLSTYVLFRMRILYSLRV